MILTRALDGRRVLRTRRGLQIRLGNLAAAVTLAVATVVLAVVSLGIGAIAIGPVDLLAAVFGPALTDDQAFALWDVRLPRLLMGFMAGWCVAMTGAILQSLARNPLADPGLFGLNQGSMVVIMLLLVFVPDAPRGLIPFAAVTGGLGVAVLLLWLVGGGRTSGLAILLMGIAIETVLSSVGSILILYTPRETSYALSDWMAGSLFQASLTTTAIFAPWFLLSLPAAILIGRALRCYDLGAETAMALGEPATWTRPLLLVLSVLLSAAAVTAVGPLVFLGVIAPHLAGFLSPANGRARLILAGLTGGLLVIAADALTRSIGGDMGLPIGLSLTMIGVPLFILSLRLRALKTLRVTT